MWNLIISISFTQQFYFVIFHKLNVKDLYFLIYLANGYFYNIKLISNFCECCSFCKTLWYFCLNRHPYIWYCRYLSLCIYLILLISVLYFLVWNVLRRSYSYLAQVYIFCYSYFKSLDFLNKEEMYHSFLITFQQYKLVISLELSQLSLPFW